MNAIIIDELNWTAHKTTNDDRRIAKELMKCLRSKDYDYPEAQIELQKDVRYRLGFPLPEVCLGIIKSYLLLPKKDFDICCQFARLPKLVMMRFIQDEIHFNWDDTISQYDPDIPENLTNPIQVVPIRTYSRNNLTKIFVDEYIIRDKSDYTIRNRNFENIQNEYDEYVKSLYYSGKTDPFPNRYTIRLEQILDEIHTEIIHSALCDLWGTEKCIVGNTIGKYWGSKSNIYYAVTQKKADAAVSRLVSNGAYKKLRDDLKHQFWSKFDAEVSKIFYANLSSYQRALQTPNLPQSRVSNVMRDWRLDYHEIRCIDKNDPRSIVELLDRTFLFTHRIIYEFKYILTPDTLRDALDNWKPAINAQRIDACGRKIKTKK